VAKSQGWQDFPFWRQKQNKKFLQKQFFQKLFFCLSGLQYSLGSGWHFTQVRIKLQQELEVNFYATNMDSLLLSGHEIRSSRNISRAP